MRQNVLRMQFYIKSVVEDTVNEPELPIIDAHHHLWDLHACHYPWLMARGEKRFFGDPAPIQRNYLPGDFLAESRRYVPVKSVHIQVGVAPEDEVNETAWLQEQTPCPSAIVAATDLSSPDVELQLQRHQAFSKLRGVRQIIGRHAEEDKRHNSDTLLGNPGFVDGLRLLQSKGLSFDLQMIPPQMQRVIAVLEQVPELPVALCHAGSPWDQSQPGLAAWRRGLKNLAGLPNVVCKISGLGMFKPDWEVEDLRPIVLDVIDIFSPQRVMLGSNFPVDKLYRSYDALWDAYAQITSGLTRAERQCLYYDTAAQFYRI